MTTSDSPPRIQILIAGLGRFMHTAPDQPPISSSDAPPFAPGENKRLVEADIAKAASAGFDCTSMDLNPSDVAWSLTEVKEALASRDWDGFVIGYGVRGLKEHTEVFEGAVNACREQSPRTRFVFSVRPDGVFEALKRAFPETLL